MNGRVPGATSSSLSPLLPLPLSQIAVFQPAHRGPAFVGGVVVAEEVEEAVDDVAEGLHLHRRAELGGALGGGVEVHVDLAVHLAPGGGGLVEGEGDDVGVVVVPEPVAVEGADGGVVGQGDGEIRHGEALAVEHPRDGGAHGVLIQPERRVRLMDRDGLVVRRPSSVVHYSNSGSLIERATALIMTSGGSRVKSAESSFSETLA